MKITDKKLYQLCKTFGTRALVWRQKFIGLLPQRALETMVRDAKHERKIMQPS